MPRRDAASDLSTFFDVSLDMLCIRDMAGRLIKVSAAWETVLGYTVEELEGMPLLPLIHPDDVALTRAEMLRVETETGVVAFVNRYRRRDGQYRQLEWRARRSGDKVFAMARDVTERLAVEAERDAARQAAESANQAKTDFLANMSHEIRTPLNGVIGIVEALGQTPLSPVQAEMVELIQTSGATLERLVSDILDISKVEAGLLEMESRAFDLRAALAGPIDLHRSRAEAKGLAFEVGFGEHARGAFVGDSVRIRQVLGNLLSNAVKFTHAGDVRVTVDVSTPPAAEGPSEVVLEVRDSGVGFDAESGKRLFQRFSQADTSTTRVFGGSGLGLSICKALVEMMGGQITASSEPGRGSVFRVALPLPRDASLADAAGEALAARDLPASALRGGPPLRVLLAEDHPVNQKVVQLLLAPYGVDITTVGSGVDAVAAFTASPFDLVLMDMQMPVMDGLIATRAIRAHEATLAGGPRTPILMLSANAMAQHADAAMAAGADLHVAKPVTAKSLVEGIERVLEAPATGADRGATGAA
ncbi:ATP-binding protein [uncultured Phenylobacterium sp.]|uniref:PAS domain-containing hybrid sensor histidine kinase/response regulator n=1 Tax=uncultured Phenylobacterium sp. TaxID=349273 RepID=UPI0025E735C2|nr:ATP-binding protein [uncultured Phenylobacterium sp.]